MGLRDRLRFKKIDEGATVFGGTSNNSTPWFMPGGKLGSWWARFAGTKAQPYVAQQSDPEPTPLHPLAGDTVVSDADVIHGRGGSGRVAYPYIPEKELNRKKKYTHFESMDEYPEIAAAFDIYANDCTQEDLRHRPWVVKSDSRSAIEEVERLFEVIKLERYYWDIIRNTVKYGDSFVEIVLDVDNPQLGIQRIKILNPNFILRVENEYGYLTDFLQEIPDKNDWTAMGWQSETMRKSKFLPLDKNQIVHFRLFSSDPRSYPYGRSIAALAVRTFRSLKLMEDAMLIYRLSRAPERRVFYVDTGSLPAAKAEMYVERMKQKFKKEKFYNPARNEVDERYNPMSMDEDFFVPYRGDKQTKIEVLPGAENLGEVDDVKYFRDKLLAALQIPKDYIVEHDKSPERKANLAQLDVKFARTIVRVQRDVQAGFETLARRHLRVKGFPASVINSLKIKLPDPSDMFTKRKLDIDEQLYRVIQAAIGTGLVSKEDAYREYMELTDEEIKQYKARVEKEQEEEAEKAQEQGIDPMTGMPIAGPGSDPRETEPDLDVEGGGQEPSENDPPTHKPVENFELITQNYINEGSIDPKKLKVLKRIKEKYCS